MPEKRHEEGPEDLAELKRGAKRKARKTSRKAVGTKGNARRTRRKDRGAMGKFMHVVCFFLSLFLSSFLFFVSLFLCLLTL